MYVFSLLLHLSSQAFVPLNFSGRDFREVFAFVIVNHKRIAHVFVAMQICGRI